MNDLLKKSGKLRICIVENDKLLRDSLVLFFRTKGGQVQSFSSAEEAFPVIGTHRLDILICDHNLPGMNGLEFLKQVGARDRETVRILVDAYPSARFAEEARQVGIDECLPKPFSIEEIERAIERRFRPRSVGEDPPGGMGDVPDEEMAR